MITTLTSKELADYLAKEHPSWSALSIQNQASEYLLSLDNRLTESLTALIKNGDCVDYAFGEFSLYLIRALRHNCSYFDAIVLMDAYLKDSLNGKAMILRR